MHAWMSAAEAAARLKVSRQTLYAYVSRGLLRADKAPGMRASRYRGADVDRLAAKRSASRNPRQAARASLDWGLPVLSSSLTFIQSGSLYYRGHDALALARHATLEDVAALMWPCDVADIAAASVTEPTRERLAMWQRPAGLGNPRRCLLAFQGIVARDGAALAGLGGVAAPATQLLHWMRAAATLRALPSGLSAAPLHRQLQALWRLTSAQADIVRAALVLCADHELNVSSFTTRCVASTGATLDACVVAGLAALSGARHGGATARIEAAWDDWLALSRKGAGSRSDIASAVLSPPQGCTPLGLGFGHPLYPGGDPRARALLGRLPRDATTDRLAAQVFDATGLQPSVDFALVATRRQLKLPLGAAFAIFAIGRTVGWIAHALEQRGAGGLIRPRAAYVGTLPAGVHGIAAEPEPERAARHIVRSR